jgi:hypothetical protein
MSKEQPLDERIEEIGLKLFQLSERKAKKLAPKANKLLSAFEQWLDKKLST